MAITLRNDKGSALTYQELDDNFLALTGEPNVRWIHLTKTSSEFFTGGSEYSIIWDSVIHDDNNYFTFNPSSSQISVLRPGVYEIVSNIVLDSGQDSTYSDGYCTISIKKNDQKLEYTTSVMTQPGNSNRPYSWANTRTIIDLVQDGYTIDNISINLYNSTSSNGQQIVPTQSDILIRWLGLKPTF